MTIQQPSAWPQAADSELPPAPAVRRYRARLDTVGNVSRELAKLYREARSGKIDISDASKLSNMLAIIGRIIGDSELEARISELEGNIAK
tara:strand:+ start:5262 stop:5531 length:270 start_codon:yes stop_codon:yes gene_type:complete